MTNEGKPVQVGTKWLGVGDPAPTRMGIVGKVKRLDARPFDSASPSRTVPSRVGVPLKNLSGFGRG